MKTKLYAKKTLSVLMAVLMLMSAWVFVAPEKAEAVSAATVSGNNNTKIAELNGLNFETTFTTVSGNFHGDTASTMASRGYYKNVLYSPHFPASNNNLNNSDAGVYFGTLGNTADGARVWYPETTLIWDGSTTPQIPILFDIDSNNNNRVGVKNVYISSDANGLVFRDSYWTAKSECAKDTNYYTHFTFDWIMQNNSGNYWISTSSGNDKESMCSSKGYWDIYGTYLQYTGGSFGSGNTYYKAIKPTWVCRTGSNYTGTTNKTIYVIDYVPLKNALNNAKTLINEIKANPAKYTTTSVSAFVEAAKKLVAAKPNNYINSSSNNVTGWNSAVSTALNAYNSAKNLEVQKYTITFKDIDGNTDGTYTYNYGSSVDCATLAANHANTVAQISGNTQQHQTYIWDTSKYVTTLTDDVEITELAHMPVDHTYGAYTQGETQHSRTCSVCGYVQTQEHKIGSGYETKAETCTEDGVMTYDCSVCGKKAIDTSVINNITGHDFSGDLVVKQDGKDGTHYRKCVRFNDCGTYGFEGVVDNSQAHNWDKNGDGTVDATDATSSKASTCEEAGFETYTCKVCPATWTKTLDLAAHKTNKTAAKDATNICGGDGNEAFWTCSVCYRVWKDEALTDELADTTDADSDGIPDALETKGPDHSFTGAYVSASGGKDGTHYRQCARFTQCKTYGPEEKHTWGDPAVTEATCEKTGKRVYTCTSGCGQTYEETIDKVAHSMTKHDAVEAKCGVAGSIEYYSCSICGKNYSDANGTTVVTNTVVPALEHKWTAHHDYDELKTPATCQDAAVYHNHCDYCKTQLVGAEHSYGEKDTVNGHKFDGTIKKNEDGTHSYKCTVEGCTEYGNPTTCRYEVTKDVASTCKTAGYTTYKCKDCGHGYSKTKDLDPNNHTGEGTTVKNALDAKCNTDGYTGDTHCLGCGTKIAKGTTITADPSVHPHENMKDYDAQPSTCQTEGWKAYKYCDKCGTYETAKVAIAKKDHMYKTYVSNGNGTHTATCETCDAAVATPATDTKDCTGGTANCVDKAVCTVCNTAYGNVNADNHKTVVTKKMVPATCQTEGTEAYRYCEACKKALEEIVKIEKAPHNYGAWSKVEGEDKHTRSCTTCDATVAEVATETGDCSGGVANCIEKAKCAICKAEYGAIDPAKHKSEANTLKDVVPATCQKEGFSGNYRYNCCNKIKQAGTATEKLAHKFDIEVENSRVAATCIAKGEVTYKCSTCVESEGVTAATNKVELPIDSNNHASGETVTVKDKAATCETDGYSGDVYHKCCYDSTKTDAENRKALISKGTVIKANGQHVYTEAVPEYMIAEIKEIKDENGNVTAREIVKKTAEPEYAEKIAARHADNKWYHVQQCTICGEIVYGACYTYAHTYSCVNTDTCEVCKGLCSLKNPEIHSNLVKIDAVEATHTTDGTKEYYKCADCGKFFLDDAGKKSFDPNSDEGKKLIAVSKDTVPCTSWEEEPFETVEPTCGVDGYKKYACTVEGCTKFKVEVIPATADSHEWSTEYKEIKAATCGEVGYKAIYCSKCDAMKPNSASTIPATGEHAYEIKQTVEGTSCADPTIEYYECSVCGKTKTETVYDSVSEHKWSEWTAIGGDCSTGVVMVRTCSECKIQEQKIENTNKHENIVKVRVEPTCEKEGYIIYVCKNCGMESDKVIIPIGDDVNKGHTANEDYYKIVKEATCTTAEQREYTCLHCGETFTKYYGNPLDHTYLYQPEEIATCERAGHSEYYRCVRCLDENGGGLTKEIYPALGHVDGDNDGKCDECNSKLYDEDTNNCSCMCHKEGWLMKFIYKIVNFFWKLFKINHSCACGATHY